MLIMKPHDPPVTDRFEEPTDRVCRREGRLAGIAMIGVSLAVVAIADVARRHLLPGSDVWLLGLVIPAWFVIHCVRQYRRG